MNFPIAKVLGIVGTVLGIAGTVVSSVASQKTQEAQINEAVNKALADQAKES
jgi:hypothetical protein